MGYQATVRCLDFKGKVKPLEDFKQNTSMIYVFKRSHWLL